MGTVGSGIVVILSIVPPKQFEQIWRVRDTAFGLGLRAGIFFEAMRAGIFFGAGTSVGMVLSRRALVSPGLDILSVSRRAASARDVMELHTAQPK